MKHGLNRKRQNDLQLDLPLIFFDAIADFDALAIMGQDCDITAPDHAIDFDFSSEINPEFYQGGSESSVHLSTEAICAIPKPSEIVAKRKGKAAQPYIPSQESIEELDKLTPDRIKALSVVVHANLNESSKIMFDLDDARQEVELIILEMKAGTIKCNIKAGGNTEAYLRRVLVNELNRRGRIIEVEPDRSRDSEAVRTRNANARAIVYINEGGKNQGDFSADNAFDLIEMLIPNTYRPSTPEDNLIQEQEVNLGGILKDRMPFVRNILTNEDPGERGRRMTVNQRKSLIFRELVPWMTVPEALSQAESLARIRGKRGPYYRKLTRKRRLVEMDEGAPE